MPSEEHFATRALRAGAAGYITEDSGSDEVALALRAILGGHKYVNAPLAETAAGHELLSRREYEVMLALATGRRGTHIALDLKISIKTVCTYRRRSKKMRMNTNAELTRYALENCLLQ